MATSFRPDDSTRILDGRAFECVEACAKSATCTEMKHSFDQWLLRNDDVVRILSSVMFRGMMDCLFRNAMQGGVDMSEKLSVLAWTYGATVDIANRETHLLRAVLDRKPLVVKALLAAGANPNFPATAAAIPSWCGDVRVEKMEEILDIILNAGFDINKTDSFRGETMLHFAARVGNASIVRFLLLRGAATNVKTHGFNGGETALHSAVHNIYPSSTEVIKILLYAGELSTNKNSFGCTALQVLTSDEYMWDTIPVHAMTTKLANIQLITQFMTDMRIALASAFHLRLGDRRDCYVGGVDREIMEMVLNLAGAELP